MQCRLIPRTIVVQVLPEDRVTNDRTERNSILPRLIAVDEFAPTLIVGRRHHRKISTAARDVFRGGDVREEGAQPVAAQRRGRMRCVRVPIRVKMVPFSLAVLNQLQGFEVRPWHVEALE